MLQKMAGQKCVHSHSFALLKWAALAFRRGTAAAGAACRGSAQGTALQAGQGRVGAALRPLEQVTEGGGCWGAVVFVCTAALGAVDLVVVR